VRHRRAGFGSPTPPRHTFAVTVPEALFRQLRDFADENRVSVSLAVRLMIEEASWVDVAREIEDGGEVFL
jgi:hypothetical protein